ncbi:hypothetical protein IFT84_20580 [Rhizobium sp. CFBP 8762]|uniref:hypothetical protein n=1 Tax=Rhizobium sp. CFBP 8762 TaxID=2775279 RepID=UPI00177D076D|nr:hypothetical protein [Rhizobium sp. CFBP 8762]MBD8556909.1 hypothetical protein [Rhizobium sp. CFBP 8762]
MYQRVVVKEGQGVNEVDFERLGTFPQTGIDLLTRDLMASALVYSGLLVTQSGSVTVQIAPGRLYDNGRQFASEVTEERSFAAFVPVTAGQSVICLIVAQGQEVSDDVEDRYYERPIDPNNPASGTQQSIDDGYRTKNRKVVLTVAPGIEGARPVAPVAPIGAVAVAEVLVTTSGIQSVTMRTDSQAQRLERVAGQVNDVAKTLALITQAIEGLRADQAGIKASLLGSASKGALAALQVDMALIKDRFDISDNNSPYWGDRFLDLRETDIKHPDYKALVEEGIRFPYANITEVPLSVYNPNDPNLSHAGSGLICPRYVATDGITVTAATGEMPLGGIAVQTITVEQLVEKRERVRVGSTFTICNNNQWWQSGRYDPIAGIFTSATGETYKAATDHYDPVNANHRIMRVQQYWTDTIDVPYEKFTANQKTVSGVIKAQSFLVHQERWTPRTWLGIKRWGKGAAVTAVLVECRDDGTPDPTRALATVHKSEADFKAWPERTYFPFDKPRFLAPLAGSQSRARAYAMMYFVTGDVDVATADGQSFLGGNLFSTTDGRYFDGDLTRDLVFGIDFCSFEITQIPVNLTAWNLDGGIQGIDILAPTIVPSASNIVYEINVGGVWRPLSDQTIGGGILDGVTVYYQSRVVLTGTQWAMPIIETGNSRVRLTRNGDKLTWVSADWLIGEQATEFSFRVVVAAHDADRHTLNAKCLHGAGYKTATAAVSVTSRVVAGREVARPDQEYAVEMEWTFKLPAAVDRAKFRLDGSTSNHRLPYNVEWAAARKTA